VIAGLARALRADPIRLVVRARAAAGVIGGLARTLRADPRRAARSREPGWSPLAVLAALALVVAGGGPASAGQELTLSVAISMKDAIEDLGRRFAAARPDVTLRYNLGASGALQKQIEAGAPVDVFISAADREMDELERRRLILGETRRAFAGNVLVVITPADAPLALAGPAALLDGRVRRIVIGDPKTVPAGRYAEESLRALGLWERMQARLVLAENVRQVLDYVARGEVDAGFVYATDAATRPGRVREAFRPAGATYRPVVYPAAVVAGSRQASLARAFVDHLVSAEGQAVLRTHGFRPPPPGAR
jgi:molybdate transport system substrate-binding protein